MIEGRFLVNLIRDSAIKSLFEMSPVALLSTILQQGTSSMFQASWQDPSLVELAVGGWFPLGGAYE